MKRSRYLLVEARRSVLSLSFVAGLLIAVIAGLSGVLPELRFANQTGSLYVFNRFHDGALAVLGPMVATLPFARSYSIERNARFSRSVLCRLRPHLYAATKLSTNALAGGLVLALPLAGAALWARLAFPEVTDPNGNPTFFPSQVATMSPAAYMCAMIGLAFLFGATFAMVGLAASVLFRRPFVANVLPLVLYVVPALFLFEFGLAYLDPPMMWDPGNHSRTSLASLLAQYALLGGGSVIVTLVFLRLKEE